MRTSIIGTFFLASPSELQEGLSWYSQASLVCERISNDTGVPYHQVAGIVAALSPQNPWERNLQDANSLCLAYVSGGVEDAQAVKVGTFGNNKRKAISILQAINEQSIQDILNGLKVQNFYASILGSRSAVCVDGHAYSIWLGERVSTSDTPKITPRLYQRILQDYSDSTDKLNSILGTDYLPFQVQAVTWVVHRNLYGGKRKKRSN